MLPALALITVALSGRVVAATPADDVAILTTIAGELCTKGGYAILGSISHSWPSGFVEHFDMDADLKRSLIDRNPHGTPLPDADYHCLRMVDTHDIYKVFTSEGDGWVLFRKKYSPARSTVGLTLPGYSADGNLAVVIVSSQCDWLCGGGELWELKRQGDHWLFTRRTNIWVS
jgi:hypothetical protein